MKVNSLTFLNQTILLAFLLLFIPFCLTAQPVKLNLNEIISVAKKTHPLLNNCKITREQSNPSTLAAFKIEPTTIQFNQGKFYSPKTDRLIEVRQPLGSPFTWSRQHDYNQLVIKASQAESQITEKQIFAEIKSAYYKCVFQREKYFLIRSFRDSLFKIAGEKNLYKTNPDTFDIEQELCLQKISDIVSNADMAYNEMLASENNLVQAAFLDEETIPADSALEMYQMVPSTDTATRTPAHLHVEYFKNKQKLTEANYKLEKSKYTPQFFAGYYTHSINGKNGYSGWEAGMSIPLWFFPQKQKIQQAQLLKVTNENEIKYQSSQIEANSANLITELNKYFDHLNYFYNGTLQRADMIEQTSQEQFNSGKITIEMYIDYLISVHKTRQAYLETMHSYNQKAIELELYAY